MSRPKKNPTPAELIDSAIALTPSDLLGRERILIAGWEMHPEDAREAMDRAVARWREGK